MGNRRQIGGLRGALSRRVPGRRPPALSRSARPRPFAPFTAAATTLDHTNSAVPPPGVAIAEARLEEVADGIYAYIQPDGSWWINNTGFLVGRGGVVSVAACSTERRTRASLAAIASVTEQPVRTLINTHHHGDHTFGNYLFAGATIVAHDKCREEMRNFGPPRPVPFWTEIDWGDIELEPPF